MYKAARCIRADIKRTHLDLIGYIRVVRTLINASYRPSIERNYKLTEIKALGGTSFSSEVNIDSHVAEL
jgi:hypothetical protein